MSRTQRLLSLLQILRRHRHPVQGQQLADELGISIRTLYRYIATLHAQGADIQGAPGLGYTLRPGFTLPPLMFTRQEIAALVLGSRWVAKRSDPDLAQAATEALTKIAAVLPPDLRVELDTMPLLVGPANGPVENIEPGMLRQAIHDEIKLHIHYRDLNGRLTERLVWPIALGHFEQVRILIAWCELRQGFRHFRTDRIEKIISTQTHYPERRHTLLNTWKTSQNIPG